MKTIERLAQMIQSRNHEGRMISYEIDDNGEHETGGEIEILTSGQFYCAVGGEDYLTYSLMDAELFLFNNWLCGSSHERATRPCYDDALRITDRPKEKSIGDRFKAIGFSVWNTGGGCTAYGMQLLGGNYILVTEGEDACIPENKNDLVTVCMYTIDGNEWIDMLCNAGDTEKLRAIGSVIFFANPVWQALRAE